MAKRKTGGVSVLEKQIADLEEQATDLEERAADLVARREKIVELQSKVDAVHAEMALIMTGETVKHRSPAKRSASTAHAGNSMTTGLAMAKALVKVGNDPMGIADLTAATLRVGWQTKSAKPSTVIGQVLLTDSDFKGKGSKGSKVYSLKPAAYKKYRKEFS